jgi:bifunctional non-homologous end joining protein LigD
MNQDSSSVRLLFDSGPVTVSLKCRVVLVPSFQPLTLGRAPAPFSHPDWLFEVKWDGFRSLVRIEHGKCRLISRRGNEFKSFRTLNESLLAELKVQSVVLDGEIVCLNDAGKTEFRDLLFRRGEPRFVAFDLLWCDGQDLRYSPLTERKHRLRSILPARGERLMYCDHVDDDGEGLFRVACENDLEGVVAKRKFDPYIENQASWVKIRNTKYSQWEGREELFERERESDPDLSLWDDCVSACAELDYAKL